MIIRFKRVITSDIAWYNPAAGVILRTCVLEEHSVESGNSPSVFETDKPSAK